MFKIIALCMALAVLPTGSAMPRPASSTVARHTIVGDPVYGLIINSDGGAFDGIALVQAVRTSRDQMLWPSGRRWRGSRAAM